MKNELLHADELKTNFLIARVAKHDWEEPVISGENGSGTIFFGGCSLRCVFCQNYQISRGKNSLSIPSEHLISLMRMLADSGVHNLNLVTPSHYARPIAAVLEKVRKHVQIPIVYNSSGYDKVEDLRRLEGLIDVYLPDLKYVSSQVSLRYSGVSNYFERASKAIIEMRRQQPRDVIMEGIMKRGMIVRHLILPTLTRDSKSVLDYIAAVDKSLHVSLMSQYFPCGNLDNFSEINRRISLEEYATICDYFFEKGLKNGYTQELDSAIEDYVPDFDLETLQSQIREANKWY